MESKPPMLQIVKCVIQSLKSRRIINPIFSQEFPDKMYQEIADEVDLEIERKRK